MEKINYENVMIEMQDYFKNNKPLDNNLIKKYIKAMIEKSEMEDACKEIIISENVKLSYSENENKIYINPIYQSFMEKDLINKLGASTQLHNLLLIYNINHEMYHMYMNSNKYYNEIGNQLYYSELIKSDLYCEADTIVLKKEYYLKYHDYFLMEYLCIINGFHISENIIVNYLKDYIPEYLINKYNQAIASKIGQYYKHYQADEVSCPIKNSNGIFLEIYNKIINCESFEENIEIIKNFFSKIDLLNIKRNYKKILEQFENASHLDKILYGVPIDDDLLNYVDEISKNKCKTISLCQDIDTYSI